MSDLHKAVMRHGQLDPRTALEHARTMMRYVDSFNNQKFSPVLDSVDRQNLAVALDNLQETAAMLLNMAERVPLREALAAPVVPPGYALVPVEPTPEMLQVFSVQDHYAVRYSKRNPRDKLYEVFSRETIDVVEAFGSEDLADELAARLSSMQRYRAMLAAAPQPKDKP